MTDWTITRDGTTETNLFDVQLTDTLNPFGDELVFRADDIQGDKFDQYSRGTEIDATVTPDGGSANNKFSGYVVETREREQQGADVLEATAYTFDQFLRRDQVSTDVSGQSIESALESIITADTPVSWNALKVGVGDNKEVKRPLQGVTVERATQYLSFESENEAFGVDDSIDFFFREREPGTISRGIDNTQWITYDLPEVGKDVVNEVEVWYDNGNKSVVVDAPGDKLDLQDSLNLPDPGRQRDEISRPLITSQQAAEAVGLQYLRFRQESLTGTVTTFGLFEASPGDTIDINIKPRGIDDEFRVTAIEYDWLADETTLSIVEQRDATTTELLVRLSEAVDRVEMESADRASDSDRVVSTNMRALVEPSATVDGTGADAARWANDGRNLLREAWAGRATIDSVKILLGDDGSDLSRTNSGLQNKKASASASTSFPDSTTVRYSASFSSVSGITEIGIESNGTLLARVTYDTAQTVSDVEVDLTVSNDGTVERGVVTNTGQTELRNLLGNNSPSPPKQFAVGTDDTAAAESDTSLGNRSKVYELDNRSVQSADSTSEWEDVT